VDSRLEVISDEYKTNIRYNCETPLTEVAQTTIKTRSNRVWVVKVKVKQSPYRPGVAQRVPGS